MGGIVVLLVWSDLILFYSKKVTVNNIIRLFFVSIKKKLPKAIKNKKNSRRHLYKLTYNTCIIFGTPMYTVVIVPNP